MLKLKKTCKKAKGLKIRLEREKFLDRLKNPSKYITGPAIDNDAAEILRKIRARNHGATHNKTMAKIKKLAGLE